MPNFDLDDEPLSPCLPAQKGQSKLEKGTIDTSSGFANETGTVAAEGGWDIPTGFAALPPAAEGNEWDETNNGGWSDETSGNAIASGEWNGTGEADGAATGEGAW